MLARLFCLVCGLALSTVCMADSAFDVQTSAMGTPHSATFSLTEYGSDLVGVGAGGQVFVKRDGKEAWGTIQLPGEQRALLDVAKVGESLVAVGQEGLIYTSKDAKDWSSVESGSQARLFGISGNDQGLAVAVGAFGAVLRSTDGGRSWDPVPMDWMALLNEPYEPHIYDVHVDASGRTTIVGEFGMVAQSPDGAGDWSLLRKDEASLFAIAYSATGNDIYAVGQAGELIHSSNSGDSWQRIETGTESILLNVSVDAEGNALVSGLRDCLWYSRADRRLQEVDSPVLSEKWYSAATVTNDERFYLAGQAGHIVSLSK